jgi:hypothetical protein
MLILSDAEEETHRLINMAGKEGICLRLLGGLAFKITCPNVDHLALKRNYADIDMAVDIAGGRKLEKFLTSAGYVGDRALNTLNGDRRQLFFDEENNRQLDIFVGDFEMCHKIPFQGRLTIDPLTVPLAELFLSKAQIVQINQKDLLDLFVLLLDHEVGNTDGNTINCSIVSAICARDWGLYTTVTLTIEKVGKILINKNPGLDAEEVRTIQTRIQTIQQAMDAAPKTFGWKTRARIGKRLRWYEEVEEIRR